MKIKILDQEFNDKNFWSMFSPKDALEYFIPDRSQWQALGITFTIQDTSLQDRYLRHIEIWAEGDEQTILMLILKHGNK